MSREKDFRQLLSQLADPDPRVREDVIGKIDDFWPENRTAVSALIRCMQDPDQWVRASAAHALGQFESAALEAVPVLLRALKDPDWTVREWSATALGFIGPRTEEAVLALIEAARDPRIRYFAFQTLGSTGSAGVTAVPFLIRELGNVDTASMAAEALSRLGAAATTAIPALIEALKMQDFFTRLHVAEALGSIGPPARESVRALLDALNDREFYERALKENTHLVQGAPKILGPLGPEHPGRISVAIATALWRIAGHQAAISALAEQLHATSGNVRRLAARHLGLIGPPACSAIADLIHASTDEDACVRGVVLITLARITTAASAVAAMTCALKDVAEGVRVDAAEALAEVGPLAVAATSALQELTASDSSAMVRLKAAWALWRIWHWPRSLDLLIESMRDPCSDVRIEAIKALRAMGASASPAVEAIENAVGDDDVYVREYAKDAMQMLESDTGRWN